MEFKINDKLYNKLVKFANDRIKGSGKLYNSRGKSSNEKLLTDLVAGAAGEFAVYEFLKSINLVCSEPDLEIYSSKNKSFDCDLKCGVYKIHVKSQTVKSVKRYGHSWLLQRTDPLCTNPDEFDLFAFTEVDLDKRVVQIIGFCNVIDIKDNDLYGECKIYSFRRTKKALYLQDLSGYDIIRQSLLKDED